MKCESTIPGKKAPPTMLKAIHKEDFVECKEEKCDDGYDDDDCDDYCEDEYCEDCDEHIDDCVCGLKEEDEEYELKPIKNNNMIEIQKRVSLETLKEEKRSYGFIKPISEYIKEQFSDCYEDFTPDLVKDFIQEMINGERGQYKFVMINKNRLFNVYPYPWNSKFGYCSEKKGFENLALSIESSIEGIDIRESYYEVIRIKLSDLYVVEDQKELIKLENALLADELKEVKEQKEKVIEVNDELLSDMKKYNLKTPDTYRISKLKKLEVLRNMKNASDEDVLKALGWA